MYLGAFLWRGLSFLAIISKNLWTNWGLGYNSISLARTKCVSAASRAIFLPTFTGYNNFFCVLYNCCELTLTYGDGNEQLNGVARISSALGI